MTLEELKAQRADLHYAYLALISGRAKARTAVGAAGTQSDVAFQIGNPALLQAEIRKLDFEIAVLSGGCPPGPFSIL